MELISSEKIQNRIFTIRGVQVMLDKDLASFYGIKPIRLREQVRRNPNRFPDDFVLKEKEVDFMVSHFAIPSKQSLGGSLPLVFTEQGVAAVSGVIKSEKAEIIKVLLLTKSISKTLALDVKKVDEQFRGFEVKELGTSHDRFLIIDRKELYHIGASLKDLGKKWFAFSKLDGNILKMMLGQIKKEVVI